ncbi:hypothetical protein TVAG_122110 [Trichomonas vaginalis G3]|uniref:Uncharacterized protein n=1 Tax=Trichomonas vaginalis (strain ATCC PRA-98 / G3) TaxID=412133 RepID=A2GE47_TRIV3|nr:hypothetical protein TVAGG3_0876820 [Trichomonas vaginalis G3]EAX84569.1 hypothetical protein TVAG_122110 [Trichomonas vaginalis G3]KAI5501749.1 hypothetical protein TVAGG3_0876820 [Trichomonas vaginalis G3]|eukprot:XP_001297499.1 hypothetical protein [Trichomonas vaginalis G3]
MSPRFVRNEIHPSQYSNRSQNDDFYSSSLRSSPYQKYNFQSKPKNKTRNIQIDLSDSDSDEDLPDPKIYNSSSDDDEILKSDTEVFIKDLKSYKNYFNNLPSPSFNRNQYILPQSPKSAIQKRGLSISGSSSSPTKHFDKNDVKISNHFEISDSVAYEASNASPSNYNNESNVYSENKDCNENQEQSEPKERSIPLDATSTITFVEPEPSTQKSPSPKKFKTNEDIHQIFRELPQVDSIIQENNDDDDDMVFIPPKPDEVVKGDPMELFKKEFVSPFTDDQKSSFVPKAWDTLTETPAEFFETLQKNEDDEKMMADSEGWGQPMDEEHAKQFSLTEMDNPPAKRIRRVSSSRSQKTLLDQSMNSVSSEYMPPSKRKSILINTKGGALLEDSMLINMEDSTQNVYQMAEYADSENMDEMNSNPE